MLGLLDKKESLNEISVKTGLPKTTIYHHYRKKYPKKVIEVKISKNMEDIGEFLGIFASDGYSNIGDNYHYVIRLFFNVKENQYIEEITTFLTKFFNKPPSKFQHKCNATILRYYSKKIFDFISFYLEWNRAGKGSKSRTIRLVRVEKSKKFKIGFLRGCIDADGYINKNKIIFATSSEDLANTICNFLYKLKIKFTYNIRNEKRKNRIPMKIIYIRREDRQKFFNVIKPRKCVEGESNPHHRLASQNVMNGRPGS